jgi:hypothetical protein
VSKRRAVEEGRGSGAGGRCATAVSYISDSTCLNGFVLVNT